MIFNFANVLVFILVGAGFVGVSLLLSRLLRPSFPTPEKELIYECGEIPVQGAWINYNLRYYLVAITFVIFSVEIAFVYPVAVTFRDAVAKGEGWLTLVEILIFALILFVGLLYVWVKGDLKWFKNVVPDERLSKATPETATLIRGRANEAQ
ncbi:MAG: NADH-quinone oxidoreductase subunit A [Deltaproteobacteria bacterium]|nr:NADH-quinone oxidoreductase subunit A [Deltaproteobacteria bacterium]